MATHETGGAGSNLPILALPKELIQDICDQLDRKDIGSFRLTCRELSNKTRSCFIGTLFTTVRTDCSAASLRRLVDIAGCKPFARTVRTLVIEPQDSSDSIDARDASILPFSGDAKVRGLLGGHYRKSRRMPPAGTLWPIDRHALLVAVAGFTNLRCVTIMDVHNVPPSFTSSPSFSVYSAVFGALTASKRKVKTIIAGSGDPSYAQDLLGAQDLIDAVAIADDLDTWSELESLHLAIDTIYSYQNSSGVLPKVGKCLRRLLESTSHLHTLDISCPNAASFLFPRLLNKLNIQHLSSLRLQHVFHIDGELIAKFVLRHTNTLRKLEIVNVDLAETYDFEILESLLLDRRLQLTTVRLDRIFESARTLRCFGKKDLDRMECPKCYAASYSLVGIVPVYCEHATLEAAGDEETVRGELRSRLRKTYSFNPDELDSRYYRMKKAKRLA